MKLADALQVRVGDVLASPYTTPAYRPHKVKAIWASADRQHVRFQLTHFASNWIDHEMWIRVPEDARWQQPPGGAAFWIRNSTRLHLTLEREHPLEETTA